jgi:trigger factor
MKFQTNLHRNDDKSFLLEVEIPKKEVKSKYEEIVDKQAQKANVKGFRKGKAPVKVVEEKIGQDKLKNILVEEIIKEVYPKAIKDLDLNPIIHPKIDIKTTELENDWEINFTSAELPKVEVNTLYDKVKEANRFLIRWF